MQAVVQHLSKKSIQIWFGLSQVQTSFRPVQSSFHILSRNRSSVQAGPVRSWTNEQPYLSILRPFWSSINFQNSNLWLTTDAPNHYAYRGKRRTRELRDTGSHWPSKVKFMTHYKRPQSLCLWRKKKNKRTPR